MSDGAVFPEIFANTKPFALWEREDVVDFAYRMRGLMPRDRDRWRWHLDGGAIHPELVVESGEWTVRSGPLRVRKCVREQVAAAGVRQVFERRRSRVQ